LFLVKSKLIPDVNSVLELLNCAAVGDVAGVLEVHAASILKDEVCRFVSYCVHTLHSLLKRNRGKGGQNRD
jgi:hypothetical protein